MKYIIVSHNDTEVPIIFPDNVPHTAFRGFDPISAGRCHIYIGHKGMTYTAFGESTGLRISSRNEDSAIIKKAFEFEGV
jgi:hypothetical protein